ncbi:MAG: hypothetical protein QMD78_07420 [Methanocellales archaeon]|nr:hypothetical protein [Methanocellales archaeon]
MNIRPNRGISPYPDVKMMRKLDEVAKQRGLKHWWELKKAVKVPSKEEVKVEEVKPREEEVKLEAEEPYACDICGFKAKSMGGLAAHRRVHI